MVISPSEFRANQRKYFDLASTERVIIRRSKAQSFALVPTHDKEFTISEELKRKISQAREDYKEGKGVSCKNFWRLSEPVRKFVWVYEVSTAKKYLLLLQNTKSPALSL